MNKIMDTAIAIQECTDTATVGALAEKFLYNKNLDLFAVAFIHQDGMEATEFVPLTNIAPAFVAHYAESDYFLLDPLAQFCLRTSTPFVWEEQLRVVGHSPVVRRIYSEAAEAGLVNGFTMPVRDFQGLRGTVSFAGPRAAFGDKERHELSLLALVMHQRVGELCRHLSPPDLRLRLTRREQETLKWGAQGKTSEDIAEILGVTKRTVDQHFENAARKLNTVNRIHTVVKAYRHNLFSF